MTTREALAELVRLRRKTSADIVEWAQAWAAAREALAQPEPEPVASDEDMYAVWLLGYQKGKDEAAPPAQLDPTWEQSTLRLQGERPH